MLVQSLIPSSKYGVKSPYAMSPIGVCIHNTYNDASAKNEISYMKSNNNQVSYHIAVDDVEAIQAIPFDRSAWHAGDGSNGDGNRKYIGIEICYSKSGGTKFTNAEKRAAKEVAALLKKYGWGIDRVRDHRSFSGKNCPHRTNMTAFKNLVQTELSMLNVPSGSAPSTTGFATGNYGKKVKATDVLNVRSGRGTEHGIIGQLAPNTIVTVDYILPDNRDGKGNSDLWGSISYGGKIGYIHLGYVTPFEDAVVRVGSKVKVVGNTYATGQNIPNWVKSDSYTVKEVKSDRALLQEISSWVFLKDLKLI